MKKSAFIAVVFLLNLLFSPLTGTRTETDRPLYAPVPLDTLPEGYFTDSLNIIRDPRGTMNRFYEQLALLRQKDGDPDHVVSIFHIGDSHIQAGFFTGTVMRNFHRDFGNAGRGLITPLKIAKTNEPFDYIIRSDHEWDFAKCITLNTPLPVGIGGVSIMSRQSVFSLTVGALEKYPGEDYSFNRLHIFHYPSAPPLDVHPDSPEITARYFVNESPYMSTIQLNRPVSQIELIGIADPDNRDSSIYYGFVLENGQKGVLYNAAGINGTQFLHWTRVSEWEQQARALDPSLVVLSFGTNESFLGSHFKEADFIGQMDLIVRRIREQNPEAVVLITTPAESFQRKRVQGRTTYVANELLGDICGIMSRYADSLGIACWDLFELSGGRGSSAHWQENKLLGKDRIHFTADGYGLMAEHFYRAIIKGYNDYVADPGR